MLPRRKCPKCGHEWIPRKPNPVKCPSCQTVLGVFKEGITAPSMPIESFGAEERLAQAIISAGTLAYQDFSIYKTKEEFAPIAKKEGKKREQEAWRKWKSDILKAKDRLLEALLDVLPRQPFTPAGSGLTLTGLEWRVGNVNSSRKVKADEKRWADLLAYAEQNIVDDEGRAQAFAKFEKEVREHAKIMVRPVPSEEEMKEKFDERQLIFREVIPVLKEGLKIIIARRTVLEEAEKKAIPLLEDEHDIAMQGHKLMEEIKPLLVPFSRSFRWEEEKNERKLAKKLKPLYVEFKQLEKVYGENDAKINELQVDVRRFHFPTLTLPERLKKLLMEV